MSAELIQGSAEWLDARLGLFNASAIDTWILDPSPVRLTVPELKTELDLAGIVYPKSGKKEELLALLPNLDRYRDMARGARTAIIRAVKEDVVKALRAIPREDLSFEDRITLDREEEIAAKEARNFEYNIPVKYGNLLEPYARQEYEAVTGYEVEIVGQRVMAGGGAACSPDGIIGSSHGLEIKCPTYETHIGWLLDYNRTGEMPEEHKIQVHASIAICEFDRWDFISYCPGEVNLIVSVHRDDFTEQVSAGIRLVIQEKKNLQELLRKMQNAPVQKFLSIECCSEIQTSR